MSRNVRDAVKDLIGFPRTRGDEPAPSTFSHTTSAFSPHTRG